MIFIWILIVLLYLAIGSFIAGISSELLDYDKFVWLRILLWPFLIGAAFTLFVTVECYEFGRMLALKAEKNQEKKATTKEKKATTKEKEKNHE